MLSGGGGRESRVRGVSVLLPAFPSSLPGISPPKQAGQGEGVNHTRGRAAERFERQRLDSCVCCGIFKRINAGSNHSAMLDLFLAQAGHCSISAAAGPRGCRFKCKWVIAAAPANFAQLRESRPGRGEGYGDSNAGPGWGKSGSALRGSLALLRWLTRFDGL